MGLKIFIVVFNMFSTLEENLELAVLATIELETNFLDVILYCWNFKEVVVYNFTGEPLIFWGFETTLLACFIKVTYINILY